MTILLLLVLTQTLSAAPRDALCHVPDVLSGPPCHALPPPRSIAFPLPPGLKQRVQFWERIFSHTHSHQFVIHDRRYPELVYKVIEVCPRHGESETAREQREDEVLDREISDIEMLLKILARKGAMLDTTSSELMSNRYFSAMLDTASSELMSNRYFSAPPPALQPTYQTLAGLFGKYPHMLAGAADRVRGQRGMADRFRRGLITCTALRGELERTLRLAGAPAELFWLVFVETMCNPAAYSRVGAAGLWQLMPATAREMGLLVTRRADQRLDPLKSTRVAARILVKNKQYLGNWPLAITGYNHGPYGVKRLIKKLGTTDLNTMIYNNQKTSFGFASGNFFAELLAAIRVGERHNPTYSTCIGTR